MYLGDSETAPDSTFLFPLMAVWKKKAEEGDSDAAAKVETASGLPQIRLVTLHDSRGLPEEATVMISHGGYRVLCLRAADGKTILAVNDIPGNMSDENGRNTPFVMIMTGDTDADREKIEKAAAYFASRPTETASRLSGIFQYNAEKNGLECRLKELDTLVAAIAEKRPNVIYLQSGKVKVDLSPMEAVLILPEGISKDYAVREQRLGAYHVEAVKADRVVPLDNPEKAREAVRKMRR